MRKLMRMRYALWLCVLATPAAAQPDISSGNFMLPYCQAWVQGKPLGHMEGVCAGAISALAFVGEDLSGVNRFCPPPNATIGQHQRVVVAYLKRNPQLLH
jgi:Rap1a immunity proteins